MSTRLMAAKWIFILSICCFFGCKTNTNISLDCDLYIPRAKLVVEDFVGKTAVLTVNDSFPIKDWGYWEELVLFLNSKECFQGLNEFDSLKLVIHTPKEEAEYWNSVAKINRAAATRKNSPLYFSFWENHISNPSFRSHLVLMRHVYGKQISPNPQNNLMYNGPFLLFLLKISLFADREKEVVGANSILDSLINAIEPHDRGFALALDEFKY